ncbi:MAG: futalosine hydrolase [Phycisphaerales bacterium]|nr:futalosine hydrolase [Phycisphaerales bacterium]
MVGSRAMAHALRPLLNPGERILLLAAAPLEARAIQAGITGHPPASDPPVAWHPLTLDDTLDLVVTGVGKANAAAACARTFDPHRHRAVVNLGVGGALPRTKVKLGEVVLADHSSYADEGCITPDTFLTMARMHFGPGMGTDLAGAMGVGPEAWLHHALAPLADHVGGVTTVSTCSGRNRVSREYQQRTGALVEAMEGAGIAFTVHRLTGGGPRAPFAELRVVSNTTGSRARQ